MTRTLQRHLVDRLEAAYRRARKVTAKKLVADGEHAAAAALSGACPYTLEQGTGDWPPGQS
jgi:hypothetical protein